MQTHCGIQKSPSSHLRLPLHVKAALEHGSNVHFIVGGVVVFVSVSTHCSCFEPVSHSQECMHLSSILHVRPSPQKFGTLHGLKAHVTSRPVEAGADNQPLRTRLSFLPDEQDNNTHTKTTPRKVRLIFVTTVDTVQKKTCFYGVRYKSRQTSVVPSVLIRLAVNVNL